MRSKSTVFILALALLLSSSVVMAAGQITGTVNYEGRVPNLRAIKMDADPGAVAFDALQAAKARNTDVLIIDTAGRLHSKTNLMEEIKKVQRVLTRQDEDSPQRVLLALDATTGQNAHAQVEVFRELTQVTGLVVTKLDGSARGGVLVALAERFGWPVHAIGFGEAADDLRPFEARAFARSLLGVEDA